MYLVFLYDCRLSTYKNLNCTLGAILKSQAIVLPTNMKEHPNVGGDHGQNFVVQKVVGGREGGGPGWRR